MDLAAPISSVKGVGEKTTELFNKAGIFTVRDLLYMLPRTYEDFSIYQQLNDIKPGKITVKAKVDNIKLSRKRRGLSLVEASISDNTNAIRAVWFNQPYRAKQFTSGKDYYFSGNFEYSYGRYQLMNPSAELASDYDKKSDKMQPIYRACGQLKPTTIKKVVRELEPFFLKIPELLPDQVVLSQKLISRKEALYMVHFPEDEKEVQAGRDRLAFDELFELVLASKLNKSANNSLSPHKITFMKSEVTKFVSSLPYKLTNSQRIAAWEIIQDFAGDVPMNRLLQGDVGSGKTVVAGLAAYQATVSGFQSAVMAPTEVLAFQHAETLNKLLSGLGIKVAILTGSTKNKAELKKRISSGEVDIVVGTHALLSDGVKFKSLGFVVIDEQHRFGVNQRQKLLEKGNKMPHLLSMTATPIPRSLQLTLFGELDISILKEKPIGRLPIKTEIISPNSLDILYEKMRDELEKKHQIYFVCSLIEDSVVNEQRSVKREQQRLKKLFPGYEVGLLHGKMKSIEKDQVMQDFSEKKIGILVCTTVVEVGVDVANANLIVISDADKFGLSQLHQLRGRVGRSSKQSYCYLITSTSAKPTRRLKEIEKSNDGFYLAEKDLELRGPGEIYGSMQHGVLDLDIASINDTRLVTKVSRAVDSYIKSGDNLLKYKELVANVERYQRLTTLN